MDNCTSFHIDNGAFLGRIVRLDEVLNVILGKHKYPTQVSATLAECTALGILLSSTIKYNGLFTLQIESKGQISMVAVDVTSDGKIRACANFDAEKIKQAKELRKTEDVIEEAPHYLGEGVLAFTVDQGENTQLYQGIVELRGKTMSECAARYFKQSEQIDTYLQLYLQVPKSEHDGWKAAGVLLQKMPEIGGKVSTDIDIDELWNEAQIFMQSLKTEEIFDYKLSSSEILNRLYHANNLVISNTKEYKFGCRCRRDKLLNTLHTFSQDDIEAMIENNKITATCGFCAECYSFEPGEISKH